jgi:hypothetical protein
MQGSHGDCSGIFRAEGQARSLKKLPLIAWSRCNRHMALEKAALPEEMTHRAQTQHSSMSDCVWSLAQNSGA